MPARRVQHPPISYLLRPQLILMLLQLAALRQWRGLRLLWLHGAQGLRAEKAGCGPLLVLFPGSALSQVRTLQLRVFGASRRRRAAAQRSQVAKFSVSASVSARACACRLDDGKMAVGKNKRISKGKKGGKYTRGGSLQLHIVRAAGRH